MDKKIRWTNSPGSQSVTLATDLVAKSQILILTTRRGSWWPKAYCCNVMPKRLFECISQTASFRYSEEALENRQGKQVPATVL